MSCAVAYWKCEAGDPAAHMELISGIMEVGEIAKEGRIIRRWQRGLGDLKEGLETLSNGKYQMKLTDSSIIT